MLRTILTPNNTHIQLDIPAEYIGRKVEITCLPLDETTDTKRISMGDFWGILSDETANQLREDINKSRDGWERDI